MESLNPFDKQRYEGVSAFHSLRDNKLEESISILKEGLDEFKKLKSEWETILMTVDDVNTLDKLKDLLILAFHYDSLEWKFGDKNNIKIIEQFIENPHDPLFAHPIEGTSACCVVARYTNDYPITIRRYRHLNKFRTSERDIYYNVFKFENSSLESRDMIYGCVLFHKLLKSAEAGSDKCMIHFIIKCMERVIELTHHDENIVSLYTLFFEVNNLYEQSGGGGAKTKVHSRHDILVKLGDYITKNMRTAEFHIILSDYCIWTLSVANIGEELVPHLIYQKNIIPREYLEYVTEMNEEYEREGEEGPYHEIKEFLKRRMQKRNVATRRTLKTSISEPHQGYKKTNKRKKTNVRHFLAQHVIKTRRGKHPPKS